ncbi:hypothetical protein Pint_13042 [Pistacia integerrima]|uniref:Uncharacterized protein n=1 Tax=Pistacia integerrima TaxID=434235 RepID=A0ACC0YA40_9ROSI|nr:hypothetical protein Pint_13042 [Pistacia integerrima]
MIHLKDKLTTITCGSLSVTDFLISIKQIADELTALGAPPSDADLLVYATRGLGPVYKELITTIRTRDSVVPFKELFDQIINHETFLLNNDKHNSDPHPPTAHLAKHSLSSYRTPKPTFPSPALGFLPTPVVAHK